MRLWLQRSALIAATLMALSACAANGTTQDAAGTVSSTTTAADTVTTAGDSSASQAAPSTTGSPGGGEETSTTAAPSDPSPQVEGPAAPDFTFALADGSTFSLSEEQKPVYLVFWAEW